MSETLHTFLQQYRTRIESVLDRLMPGDNQAPERLHKAMRYSVLLGGKRVRPCLVYATGHIFSTPMHRLDAPAAAIELIHAYSLIHDDLPAMDNDDLRRGMPTCHKAFDEATAILAGDGLQALAFELVAGDIDLPPHLQLGLTRVLAHASGSRGMVGGQAIDLASAGIAISAEQLEGMHRWKTGALISASVEMGAIASGVTDETTLNSLRAYALAIGLAFQVQDDILDVEGKTEVIGKTQGSDIERNKPTYVTLYGLDGAKRIANDLYNSAIENLAAFNANAAILRDLAAYIVQRDR